MLSTTGSGHLACAETRSTKLLRAVDSEACGYFLPATAQPTRIRLPFTGHTPNTTEARQRMLVLSASALKA